MLNITYAPSEAKLAEQMQADLIKLHMRLEHNILIVLVTPDAIADDTVMQTVRKAQRDKHLIAPVIIQATSLPDELKGVKTLDVTKGYKAGALRDYVRRTDLGEQVLRSNSRIFLWLMIVIVIVFSVGTWALATGRVGVPEAEFATEEAIRQQMIQTLTFPTLDALLPRSTEDAENFPLTLEAANTRNAPLLALTATAQDANLKGTEQARPTVAAQTETARENMTATAEAEE